MDTTDSNTFMTSGREPDFGKYPDGLVPAIVQDDTDGQVLMLGYMDRTAFSRSLAEDKLTFYSRSRQTLWTKGATSGHFLYLISWHLDCDADALLFRVRPAGPACHTGSSSCFGSVSGHFLHTLEAVIAERAGQGDPASSYTARLLAEGRSRVAQKVGEEAVELVIEAMGDNPLSFAGEAADLLFHLLVLLSARQVPLRDIVDILQQRQQPAS